jgi:hypothetical protein
MEAKVHLPITIVTHSLGARLAAEALFNNTGRQDYQKNDTALKIAELRKIPTPTVEVRLGIIAPATPGPQTFGGFNKRSPENINANQNNVTRIVIGYDPFDFANNKDPFRIISFARVDGYTTLGCNYFWQKKRITEIELVTDTLDKLGYKSDTLVHPVRFNTGPKIGAGNDHNHFMQFYMRDTTAAKKFFGSLFK